MVNEPSTAGSGTCRFAVQINYALRHRAIFMQIRSTSDTYTTVLPEVARAAAEAAAALIPVLIGPAETETTDARRQAFAADTVRCSAAGAEGREVLGQPDQRVRDGGDLVVR
jgi:hypothetical protein